MNTTPAILGIGTALPAGTVSQREALELARTISGRVAVGTGGCCTEPEPDESNERLARLYEHTTVRTRASVLFTRANGHPSSQSFYQAPTREQDGGPTTATRLARYAEEAPALARRAADAALADAGCTPAEIDHLITVSCTGFVAPGVDIHLIRDLGLAPSTSRTHIGFMGCHGALNALRIADALARTGARVLVVAVELCSLHYQYDASLGQTVANALFADGAAAAVVGCAAGRPTFVGHLAAFASRILPDSLQDMSWTIGDHGFRMSLSARVPALLRDHLRPWLDAFLAGHNLHLEDIRSFAVHPGGPRILNAVDEGLALPPEALAPSRQILSQHGNMSSPTVLFILDHLRRANADRPCLTMAFGPGLVAEAMLLL